MKINWHLKRKFHNLIKINKLSKNFMELILKYKDQGANNQQL